MRGPYDGPNSQDSNLMGFMVHMKPVHAASWDEIVGHIIDGRVLCMVGAHRAPAGPGEPQRSPKEPMKASMELLVLPAAPFIIPPQCQLEPLAPPPPLGQSLNPSTSRISRQSYPRVAVSQGKVAKKKVCVS